MNCVRLAVVLALTGLSLPTVLHGAPRILIPEDAGPTRPDPAPEPVSEPTDPNSRGGPVSATPPIAADGGRVGAFGPLMPFPLMPIHASLTASGDVMFFGTDEQGRQGAQLRFGVWNPDLGLGSRAFALLDNQARTDIFCGAQGLLPNSNRILIAAGDVTYDGMRNYSTPEATVYDPARRTTSRELPMQHPRWYPTMITTAAGEMLVMGGRGLVKDASGKDVDVTPDVPEVYNPVRKTWRTLTGAASPAAYGRDNWFYPRAFQAPNGKVAVLADSGELFELDPSGAGKISSRGSVMPWTYNALPSVMYAPGKVLSVRESSVYTLDLNGGNATPRQTGSLSALRLWANATVLPNGEVVVTGGSPAHNELPGAAMRTETWNPQTGQWTLGPEYQKARLYHSVAMLLPDASVLVGGGGAPGPQTNLNAEIYYPPYLYRKDGSGRPATRPLLRYLPPVVGWSQWVAGATGPGTRVSRVTMVKASTVTHSFNFEQRLIELRPGTWNEMVYFQMPSDRQTMTPGHYLIFLFDQHGVPSLGHMVRVN